MRVLHVDWHNTGAALAPARYSLQSGNEQSGNRITITATGVLHDMYADSSAEHGVNDVAARDCSRISVRASFEDGVHALRPEGNPLAVTRTLVGDTLILDYPAGNHELHRLCGPGHVLAAGRSLPVPH